MFKGFSDSSRNNEFHGFPNLNFQMNNEAYGFSGCTFWLDAAYGLNTQTDLAAVTYWKDRIQNISFEQGTAASQPRLIVADANFNNLPSIDFYSNARKLISTYQQINGGDNFTFAFVAKVDTANTVNFVVGRTADSLNGFIMGGTTAGADGIGYRGPASNNWYIGTTEDTSPHIVVMTKNNIYVDGISETTTSFNNFFSSFNVVGGASATAAGLIGKIAEFIVYDTLLSSDQCAQLSTRLNSKYALY